MPLGFTFLQDILKIVDQHPVVDKADRVSVDGKPVNKSDLKAEATGNTVQSDGVVTVGNNPAKSANSMTSSVQDAGDEPNRSGSIHTHPASGDMRVSLERGTTVQVSTELTIHGGAPSPGDHEQHSREFVEAGSPSGRMARSVAVDNKYVYLYNSSPNQTIKIPKP